MSGKAKELYVCSNCDAQSPKWSGRCLECGSWGTLELQTIEEGVSGKKSQKTPEAQVTDLNKAEKQNLKRMITKIDEVDRVFGGGLVPGSLSLLGGEPGAGKSTIVAQIADKLAKNETVVYVSGEESAHQVKSRLERLECDTKNIKFIGDTNVEKIISAIKSINPGLVIVDSIQTVYSGETDSEAGGVNQIRISTVKFLEFAKANDTAVMIIGHVTKDGQVAGPKTLEHIVDTVVYLEKEMNKEYSVLRAVKNRFGSVNEIGIFEMTGKGFREIKNPSSIFLEDEAGDIPGSVVSCVIEGSRPFLVNIQALVSKTLFGYPQRKASGFDINRLQILTSVISKRSNVNLSNQDVVVNVVGGLKVSDPALDLAVCMAIISSLLNQVVSKDTLVLGEVGLGGEVRNVAASEQRAAEAFKLGFSRVILPNSKLKDVNIDIKKIPNVSGLVDYFKSAG